jgi:hypothetical protein
LRGIFRASYVRVCVYERRGSLERVRRRVRERECVHVCACAFQRLSLACRASVRDCERGKERERPEKESACVSISIFFTICEARTDMLCMIHIMQGNCSARIAQVTITSI